MEKFFKVSITSKVKLFERGLEISVEDIVEVESEGVFFFSVPPLSRKQLPEFLWTTNHPFVFLDSMTSPSLATQVWIRGSY
jgi:hypothetical protein